MAAIHSISTGAVNSAGVNEGSKSSAAQKSSGVLTGAAEQSAATASNDTVQLSTRAQKIQKLQEDFFPSGYKSITVTPEFIERLQEYGFISAADATRLSSVASASAGAPAADSATPVATEKLANALERILDRLRDKDADNSLIATLEKADAVFSELDGPLSAAIKVDIKEVIKELVDYANSDDKQMLTNTESNTLQQLKLVMHLADDLSQENNPSDKINSYLSILKQSY